MDVERVKPSGEIVHSVHNGPLLHRVATHAARGTPKEAFAIDGKLAAIEELEGGQGKKEEEGRT
jgi:hypothetical protein